MPNLGLSHYFSIVPFLMVISLAIKEYSVIISNTSLATIIMFKLTLINTMYGFPKYYAFFCRFSSCVSYFSIK